MRDKSIAIFIGLALILMSLSVASAEEGEVEVEMEVMPDMFVLSANSPWMELDIHDYELDGYLSFADVYNDPELSDEDLELVIESVEITNYKTKEVKTFPDIEGVGVAYDRFETKLIDETAEEHVLAIMISRETLEMDPSNAGDSIFDGRYLKFVTTGTITYPDGSSVKFTATDSDVWVKLQGEMPEKAGGNGGKQ